MAEIVDATVFYLTRPHTVLATAYGRPVQEKSHVIVRLRDGMGHVGYGEATPLSKFTGETAKMVAMILKEELLPCVLGRDSTELAAVHVQMDQAIAGNYAAKSALDCAMYDLTAKDLGVPLYTLLGGKCRDSVKINRHIGITSTEQAKDMAAEYCQQGFYSLKMKIGSDVRMDARRVQAVRDRIQAKASIRVDANCGYTYTQAEEFIRLTRECDIEYYEQLLPKWDLEEMVSLRKIWGVPILADEAVNSVKDATEYASAGGADAFTIKLCKCGGLYPALQIAGVAAAYGKEVIVASTYDTQIGCSACLHLAMALPAIEHGCDLTTFASQPEMADTDHRLIGMQLFAGMAPGIGVIRMRDFPMKE